MKRSYEMDMCSGPLLGKILSYAMPLMLSGILQLLFNAADVIVVGRFAGHESLAAVGSTSALVNLLINVFIGLSIGANVLVAQYFGARKDREVSETVHTAVTVSLVCGVLLVVIGTFASAPLLSLMETPADVLDKASLYMRIYFMGMPVIMLYNFGAAILRAIGDTRRPLYFLMTAGVVNVLLNLMFVIVFHMGVAGVALATVLSQCISAALVCRCLAKSDGSYRLEFSKLRINRRMFGRIARIGLPAGFQGAVFSISNVLVQSSLNSFGSVAMAGSTAASNLEGFVYNAMNSIYQTNLSFTSQNIGGGKFSRINRILMLCLAVVTVIGLVMGGSFVLLGSNLLGIYSSDPAVIQNGLKRMMVICAPYFICGWMDVLVGSLRGLGYAVLPMLVSLTGACGLRVVWLYTVFQWHPTLETLYLAYPVTWLVTAIVHLCCFLLVRRKFPKEDRRDAA
ncbi:MAG: MATE family efflux transporter [Lachnospiraceae bacterium]|nr:MATE family efflux transporter [Lachnospiraceae bacterium]